MHTQIHWNLNPTRVIQVIKRTIGNVSVNITLGSPLPRPNQYQLEVPTAQVLVSKLYTNIYIDEA